MAQKRRRLLVGLALAAGATAWAMSRPPPLPQLTAHREGDLVFLDGVHHVSPLDLLGSGAGEPPSAANGVVVDRQALEARSTAEALGTSGPVFVAFLDYRCAYCRRHAPELLARAAEGGLQLVVRDWPIRGPASTLAARAALAAARQGAYWAFHEDLMTSGFLPTPAMVADLSARHGLDLGRLDRDMRSRAVDDELAYNAALARGVGAVGTPTYVIDGVVIAGGFELDTLLRLAARHTVA